MKKETTEIQDHKKYLFKTADPFNCLGACFELVQSVFLESLSSENKKLPSYLLSELLQLLREVSSSPIARDEEIVNQLIDLTVTILDCGWIDLMSSKESDTSYVYYRYVSFKNQFENAQIKWFFLSHDELEIFLQRQKKQKFDLETLRKLLDHQDFICSDSYSSSEEVLTVVDCVITYQDSQKNSQPVVILLPFKINAEVSGLFCLSLNSDFALYPKSQLPYQEVLRAYLKKGISFVTRMEVSKPLSRRQAELSIDSYQSKYRNLKAKMIEAFKSIDPPTAAILRREDYFSEASNRDLVAKWCLDHYSSLLEIDREQTEFLEITRSGVSAVSLAVDLSLAWTGNEDDSVFQAFGWYFENNLNETSDFLNKITLDISKARVLLVNIESNVPVGDSSISFKSYIDRALSQFLLTVASNPQKNYSLVLDVTNNPGFDFLFALDSLANLQIIKVMSLSKHQRGGQNNFFGLVAANKTNRSKNELDYLIKKNFGSITTSSLIRLSKLTTNFISKRTTEMALLTELIYTQVLEELGFAGLSIEKYSYFFFIYRNNNKADHSLGKAVEIAYKSRSWLR